MFVQDIMCSKVEVIWRWSKKTLEHCPGVAQRAFCVRIRAPLAWGATLAMLTCSQKLGSSHACPHMHHVQAGPFGFARGQV